MQEICTIKLHTCLTVLTFCSVFVNLTRQRIVANASSIRRQLKAVSLSRSRKRLKKSVCGRAVRRRDGDGARGEGMRGAPLGPTYSSIAGRQCVCPSAQATRHVSNRLSFRLHKVVQTKRRFETGIQWFVCVDSDNTELLIPKPVTEQNLETVHSSYQTQNLFPFFLEVSPQNCTYTVRSF